MNEIVKQLLLANPETHQNRTDVLINVLCVTGSGYYWDENGEIATKQELPLWTITQPYERFARLLEHEDGNPDTEYLMELMMPAIQERVSQAVSVLVDIDARVLEMGEPTHEVYPQSTFGGHIIFELPENITPEWREACDELQSILIKNGWVF